MNKLRMTLVYSYRPIYIILHIFNITIFFDTVSIRVERAVVGIFATVHHRAREPTGRYHQPAQ
jgi:hypothetical protein